VMSAPAARTCLKFHSPRSSILFASCW
jgi:hypothetical protein